MTFRPQRFRKVEEITAAQFTGAANGKDIAYWCGGRYLEAKQNGAVTSHEQIKIPNLDGDPLVARVGDYIAKNEDGSFRVIPGTAFANAGFEPYFQRTTRKAEETASPVDPAPSTE